VDGQPVLSTAVHILDNLSEGWSLYVGGSGATPPVVIRGGVIGAIPKPNDDRKLEIRRAGKGGELINACI